MPSLDIKRVLVVSGDPDVVQVLAEKLELAQSGKQRYLVEGFTDPLAALERAGEQGFNAVIGDSCMPRPGGEAFLNRIAELQPDCGRLLLGGDDQAGALGHRPLPRHWRSDELSTLLAAAIEHCGLLATARASRHPRPTLTTLRATPLLSELPDPQLAMLATTSNWLTLVPGQTVAHQNDHSDTVLFILSGYVKVVRGAVADTRSGNERRHGGRPSVMLALLGPGDMTGEPAAFLGSRRSASVVALTPCQLVEVPGKLFLESLADHPGFAMSVMRKSARYRVEAERQIELMRGSVEARIHALVRHCRQIGLDTERWLTKAEIARMVGATRVAVSQIMSEIKLASPNNAKSMSEKHFQQQQV